MINYIERFIKDFLLLILFMFVFLALNGCSGLGVDTSQNRTIAITKPPYQIVYSGDLSESDKKAVGNLITILSKTGFNNYKFNDKIIVQVAGTESEIKVIPQYTGGAEDEEQIKEETEIRN